MSHSAAVEAASFTKSGRLFFFRNLSASIYGAKVHCIGMVGGGWDRYWLRLDWKSEGQS